MVAINDMNVVATREKLSGFIGQGAVGLGVISEPGRARALEVQARLVAIHDQRPDVTAQTVNDDTQWLKIADDMKLPEDKMPAARAFVQSGAGVGHGIESSGEIAFKIGAASREDKNAMLAGQAAERTLRAVERSRNHFPLPVGEDVFVAFVKSPKWQQMSKPNDPPYLQAAQLANFKAELLEASIALAPEMLQNGEVNLQVQQAFTALEGIATTSYKNSSNVLATQHPQASALVSGAADAIAQDKHIDRPFDFEMTMERMRVVDQGMTAALQYLVASQKLSPQALQALSSPVAPEVAPQPQSRAR